MTLVLPANGFEIYANGLTEIGQDGFVTVGGTGVSASSPRKGSKAFQLDSPTGVLRWPPPVARREFYIGFGFYLDALGTSQTDIFELFNSVNNLGHIRVGLNISGQFYAGQGRAGQEGINGYSGAAANPTTLYWQDTVVQPVTTWMFLECYGYIADSGGVFTMRKNEAVLFSSSALDTKAGSADTIDWIKWLAKGQTAGHNWRTDDLYVVDPTTAPNNTWMGDCYEHFSPAASNSTPQQWTPQGSASRFENVDDVPANDDTDYNRATAAGNVDRYGYGATPSTTGAIRCVSQVSRVRKDDAGGCTVRHNMESSGGGSPSTVVNGAAKNPGTTYEWMRDAYEQDPDTNAAWTKTSRDAVLGGLERTA